MLSTTAEREQKRILITGATGRLGQQLYLTFKENSVVCGTWHKNQESNISGQKLNICNVKEVEGVFRDFLPDICLHSAAISDPDFCEEHPDIAHEINVVGTKNVANACIKTGTKLVFFSTNYVFDGRLSSYLENEQPTPIQAYGYTKVIAEKYVQAVPSSLILRLSLLYGKTSSLASGDFVQSVYNKLIKGETISLNAQRIRFPLLIDDVASIVKQLLNQNGRGIFHLSGPNPITQYEWGCLISEIINSDSLLINLIKSAQEKPARRPCKVCLSTSKIQSLLNFNFTTIRQGTASVLSISNTGE